MNGYDLSRNWFDFCFDNPEKINTNHTAIYFFAIEHCNRLGWKTKFGFPSQMTMDALGIKKHQTYIRYFNDLVDWKFFDLIQKSRNQYSANIISLISAMPKKGEALDKAIITHAAKQTQSNGQSNSPIVKPINKETNKQDKEVLDYLNEKTGKKFRTAKGLKARLSEGYTIDDVKKVIDIKCSQWLHDSAMNQFLRPQTLFSEKFEGYFNENIKPSVSANPFAGGMN